MTDSLAARLGFRRVTRGILPARLPLLVRMFDGVATGLLAFWGIRRGLLPLQELAAQASQDAVMRTTLFGSLIVSQLWNLITERAAVPAEKRRPVSVYLDEFSQYLHVGDVGMFCNRLLHLRGVNVAPTGDDHVLQPVHQSHCPICADLHRIPGVQPATANGFSR